MVKRVPIIGMSLKMYFSPSKTHTYLQAFEPIAVAAHEIGVNTFLIPDFLSVAEACKVLVPTLRRRYITGVGAQDCFWEEDGPYTGEISVKHLAELNVGYVEIGHAERRRIFKETDADVAKKCAIAAKHGLIPVICIGDVEKDTDNIGSAIAFCVSQMKAALSDVEKDSEVIFGYEPVWAIGQPEPAPVAFINGVCEGLREFLDFDGRQSTARILYGGSAKPGLFSALDPEAIDGLFIGRFGHDPDNFFSMVKEIAAKKY
ncbi:Triosephosphate isomerase [Lipomyces arxii]|uniref:Triosephosphate isomerase n=1 Tax=Lipomyces arxii TaxID=56418 RepID=UPI0034CD899B